MWGPFYCAFEFLLNAGVCSAVLWRIYRLQTHHKRDGRKDRPAASR